MKIKILSMMLVVAMIGSFSSCKKKGCTDPNSLAFNPDAKKDDGSCTSPESVKKALVFKTTATWCPYCGEWGTTYSNDLMSANSNAMVIQLHKNDEFSTVPGDEIRNVLTNGSVPHFFVGTEDMANNYNTINSRVGTELSETVEVSMALEKTTSGSSMNVRVQSKWAGSTSGEYLLAVYVLEDGQVAEQSIQGSPSDPNFVHNHVLRAEASNLGFGKAITINGDGNLEEFDISLNSSWVAANCYPVAVIWKRNGATYDFVNLAM